MNFNFISVYLLIYIININYNIISLYNINIVYFNSTKYICTFNRGLSYIWYNLRFYNK